jgi:glycosyltransferase involved in cell wall biosynthesis
MGPLEALGYGIPCIVTEGVGLGDVIESYGAGIKCETSAEGISSALNKFISSFENAEVMSESAIRLIRDNFDRDRIAEETVKKYCQMVVK